MSKLKEIVLSDASTEAKVAALAVLVDKKLLELAEVVMNTKKLEGPKGEQGFQGPKGEQGERGLQGDKGQDGKDGVDGKDGKDGVDGVSVVDARIDFDGTLVITLSNGKEITAGDVVPEGVAKDVNIITSGNGTAKVVTDTLASLQAQIDAITGLDGELGTMAQQDDTAVDINGGAIDGTSIGAAVPASGVFTTLIGGKDQVNYGQLTGGATTKAVEFKTLGSDTNVALALRSQGTGAIDLAAGSRGVNISNGGTVTAITRTAAGSGYTSAPSATISAPTTAGGVQATASTTISVNVSTPTITSGGTGYTVGDTLTFSGGTSTIACQLSVSSVSGGVITAVTVINSGIYTVAPSNPISVTGGTGTGATFTSVWGVTSTITITNAGSGYVEQPTVTFSGGGGSGAAAYATVGSGTVVKSLGSTMSFSTPGGEQFRVNDSGTSAVNYWQATGATTSSFVNLLATGSDTNVTGALIAKGTGGLVFSTNGASSNNQMRVTHTASAVNYVQVTGAATGSSPTISLQGSDTNISGVITTKGTGGLSFYTNNGNQRQLRVIHTASSVNFFDVTGAAAGAAPALSVSGTDTNIDLALTPKGTGNVRFGTYTASAGLVTSGYITIKDSGGTVRKLAVVA